MRHSSSCFLTLALAGLLLSSGLTTAGFSAQTESKGLILPQNRLLIAYHDDDRWEKRQERLIKQQEKLEKQRLKNLERLNRRSYILSPARVTFDNVSRSHLRSVVLTYAPPLNTPINSGIYTGSILDQLLGNVIGTSAVVNLPGSALAALRPGVVIPYDLRPHMRILPLQANTELGISTRLRMAVIGGDVVLYAPSTMRIVDVKRHIL